jgi:hypothetical protein
LCLRMVVVAEGARKAVADSLEVAGRT